MSMFDILIKEQEGFIAVERLAGNIVKEEFHKGAIFGLRLAESLVESARQSAKVEPVTATQQLKPKIAALATKLEKYSERHGVDNEFWFIVAEMRQLSGN